MDAERGDGFLQVARTEPTYRHSCSVTLSKENAVDVTLLFAAAHR